MKYFLTLIFVAFSAVLFGQQVKFDDYFTNQTLRLDYIHAGNSDTAIVYFEQLKKEPFWGGSHVNLVDTFNYGEYKVLVYDVVTNVLLYSRCYSTLFHEWQATPEADEINRSFYESVVVPFPKKEIKIVIQERDNRNNFFDIFEMEISPYNMFIKRDLVYDFETYTLIDNGDPAKKVDIVFLSEGYTIDEVIKYKRDVQKYVNQLFKYEPFKSNKNKFNIHVVVSISEESGTDIPGDSIWKNTILNSNFYTFGTERYLTTQDFKTVRDVAALAPYDQIYILTNTDKYGGGGIYNYYNLCVSDHQAAPAVFVHEFGHGFGGLADEYWTSDVAVDDYYATDVEPADPNITTLVDFNSKWADMVDANTPVPTPANQQYLSTVGVFEGGGYVEKGVYRPQQNCIMRSLSYPFCKVCQRAIQQMIDFYSE